MTLIHFSHNYLFVFLSYHFFNETLLEYHNYSLHIHIFVLNIIIHHNLLEHYSFNTQMERHTILIVYILILSLHHYNHMMNPYYRMYIFIHVLLDHLDIMYYMDHITYLELNSHMAYHSMFNSHMLSF